MHSRNLTRKKTIKILNSIGLAILFCLSLSGCTSTATSQLKESPCKECTAQSLFYQNGVWLEKVNG